MKVETVVYIFVAIDCFLFAIAIAVLPMLCVGFSC